MLAEKEDNAKKAKKEFREIADDVHLFSGKIDETIEVLEATEEHIIAKLNETKLHIGGLHIRLQE